MQKTILYIGGFELPDKNAAAQRVIANAKILNALGFNVVFIGVDKTINTNKLILENASIYEGFTYYSVKYPGSIYEWFVYLTSINSILTTKSIHPAYIIAYNYPAFALMRLRRYCLNKNILLIADCSEWYVARGNVLFRIIKGLDVYLRMHLIHPKLDGLIVISDYLRNFYKSKTDNLILIPPLVDLSMQKWKFDNDSIDDGKINLIYAGSPEGGGKDRIDIIIHTLSEIRRTSGIKFEFNIIGFTKGEYLKLFVNETLPVDIDEFVSFKGRLSHTDTLKEINKADYQIFIRDMNLNNMAGFPTKYVESISCGTPVLTNSSSNIEDYFSIGETGFLLDISSSKQLKVDLIKALSLNKDSILKMKSYCKSSKIFNYTNYIKPFEELLSNAVNKDKY